MFKLYKFNHSKKIEEYGEGGNLLINYWEKEIKNFKKKGDKQGRKLMKE